MKSFDAFERMPRESRVLLKNLNILQKLAAEAHLIATAASVDQQILELKNHKKKNQEWTDKVSALSKKISADIKPLLKENEAYDELMKEYWRIVRSPIFTKHDSDLNKIELGQFKDLTVRKSF